MAKSGKTPVKPQAPSPQETLKRETQAAAALLDHYREVFAGDNQLAIDMVEGSTDLNEAIAIAIKAAGQDTASVAALDIYIAEMTARKDRIARRVALTRTMLKTALEMAGRQTCATPYGTANLTSVKGGLIIDPQREADIPTHYWVPGDPRLDKKALKKDLNAGTKISGVSLGPDSKTVQLRFK